MARDEDFNEYEKQYLQRVEEEESKKRTVKLLFKVEIFSERIEIKKIDKNKNSDNTDEFVIPKEHHTKESIIDYIVKRYNLNKELVKTRITFQEFEQKSEEEIQKLREIQNEQQQEQQKLKMKKVLSDRVGKPVDMESGLEALLEYNSKSERKVKVRYFFSKDDESKLYSRDYTEYSKANLIHLQIEVSWNPKNTTWTYGGNYEIGDNFDHGYTLNVTLTHDDSTLRKDLINKLRYRGFGCLPTKKTIIGHKNDKHPTRIDARGLLQEIVEDLT